MSIAEEVRRIVTMQDIVTFALSGGYAFKKSGEKVVFPKWTPTGTPKVEDHVIVHAEGKYPDGSTLTLKAGNNRRRRLIVGGKSDD